MLYQTRPVLLVMTHNLGDHIVCNPLNEPIHFGRRSGCLACCRKQRARGTAEIACIYFSLTLPICLETFPLKAGIPFKSEQCIRMECKWRIHHLHSISAWMAPVVKTHLKGMKLTNSIDSQNGGGVTQLVVQVTS